MQTVAFVGLGAMGSGMAANLAAAGYALRVYNRTAARAQALAGANVTVCASPAEAAQGAAFVVSIVADDTASRAVMTGPDGVLSRAAPGTVIIDSSTNTPTLAREVARAADARGCVYLDAPVVGSTAQARGRELVFMVGGDAAAFEQVQPLLDAMGRMSRYMGPSGAGATIKLVNNMMSGTFNAALAEALSIAEGAGIDPEATLAILGEGPVASRALRTKGPKITGRDFSPQFQLALMEKDLRYFLALAQDCDRPAPIAALVRSQFQAARRAGFGGLDACAVFLQASGERAVGG